MQEGHGRRGRDDENALCTCGSAVLFISGMSQNHSALISPAFPQRSVCRTTCTVLCSILSVPPYHSHRQPRGSSNITKQSSTDKVNFIMRLHENTYTWCFIKQRHLRAKRRRQRQMDRGRLRELGGYAPVRLSCSSKRSPG